MFEMLEKVFTARSAAFIILIIAFCFRTIYQERTGYAISSDQDSLEKGQHSYRTLILSRDPLVIYIQNFLTSQECTHMINIRYEVLLHLVLRFSLLIRKVARDPSKQRKDGRRMVGLVL